MQDRIFILSFSSPLLILLFNSYFCSQSFLQLSTSLFILHYFPSLFALFILFISLYSSCILNALQLLINSISSLRILFCCSYAFALFASITSKCSSFNSAIFFLSKIVFCFLSNIFMVKPCILTYSFKIPVRL